MQISFLAILACGVISMVLGSIWYGPLFGRAWMRILKADPDCFSDPVKKKEAQKKAMPLYAIQFVLSLFQVWVLAHFVAGWGTLASVISALWIWVAFIMPTVAGSSMWGSDNRKDAWQKFFIQAGFQLVLFLVFAIILSIWK